MVRSLVALCCLSSIVALVPESMAAETKIRTGILDCDVSAGVGMIFTEKQTMKCTYKHLKGGHVEHYNGKIREVGIALGATAGGVMLWNVVAAQEDVPSGALAGSYSGLTADASLGLGLGANVLIGGTGKAFMLQPASIEGQVGLNVAAGVTTVTLEQAP